MSTHTPTDAKITAAYEDMLHKLSEALDAAGHWCATIRPRAGTVLDDPGYREAIRVFGDIEDAHKHAQAYANR